MWNGILVVPVEINGAVTLDFAVDSGAAYVSVPAGVFSTLKHAGASTLIFLGSPVKQQRGWNSR
jgi:hypothetical protein